MKIKNMTVEHVQLVPPSIVRGQDEAKVEDVTIQECMVMEMPTPIQIITHLRIKGNIDSLNVKRR
jgi:hypothetical protein